MMIINRLLSIEQLVEEQIQFLINVFPFGIGRIGSGSWLMARKAKGADKSGCSGMGESDWCQKDLAKWYAFNEYNIEYVSTLFGFIGAQLKWPTRGLWGGSGGNFVFKGSDRWKPWMEDKDAHQFLHSGNLRNRKRGGENAGLKKT